MPSTPLGASGLKDNVWFRHQGAGPQPSGTTALELSIIKWYSVRPTFKDGGRGMGLWKLYGVGDCIFSRLMRMEGRV